MAMDVGGAKGGVKSDINVTPLVDVMLVLLIIMMLVAPMLQQGIQVTLPKADNTTEKPETADQTVLAIGANGDFYSTPSRSPRASWPSESTRFSRTSWRRSSSSRRDQDAQYSAVMTAMDQLRQAGIEDVGLITDPRTQCEQGGGTVTWPTHTSSRR